MSSDAKIFAIKAGAIAGLAAIVQAATTIFLGGPIEYLVPGILGIGAAYIGLFDRTPLKEGGPTLKRGIALLFCAFAVYLAVPQTDASDIPWQPYAPELVDAARKGNKPVMIDFTASWCGPCKELDRKVFSHRKIADAAKDFLALRADMTEVNAKTEQIARQFNIEAFPTVVFIGADGKERVNQRLVGFERAEDFLQRMQAAR